MDGETDESSAERLLDLRKSNVAEALSKLREAISLARWGKERRIHVLTSRGLHGMFGVPKVRYRIIEYLSANNYRYDACSAESLLVYV